MWYNHCGYKRKQPMKGMDFYMLFRRNITPSCAYCKFGMSLGYGEVACSKRGIMSDDGKCGAFRYEPTKRKPEFANSPPASEVTEKDMSIEE